MKKPRVIAYYLPQYHPFKENDEWWGKGFTEWTNVARAVPLFKGHYQPHIPADLGFYDLRLPIIREQQVELAKEAGVYGFCYWHYWFGNGKQLMADIFDEVLASGKPDFPFCLGWANHSWYAKNWNTKDSSVKDKLLIEQTYPGKEDIRMHYEYVLKAFKDPRYIKQDGMPVFTIFSPNTIPADYNFIELWNQWAKEDGFEKGIYFVASYSVESLDETERSRYFEKGYNAVIPARLNRDSFVSKKTRASYKVKAILNSHGVSTVFPLKKEYSQFFPFLANKEVDKDENVIPTLIPNFDHSPRSKRAGLILNNSTPKLFQKHCEEMFENIRGKHNNLVWLRSWNEWGEGNYMEPDLKFGHGYIQALNNALKKEEEYE